MNSFIADLLLVIHFVWAAWMVSGVLLSVSGFWWPRFWSWRLFRITHLIGLIGTATVPIWARGLCPLTIWEWQLRAVGAGDGGNGRVEPFIIRWMREVLFIDLDPFVMSLIAGAGAVATLVIFISHPPRRN